MSYQVVPIDETKLRERGQSHPGRPRKYTEDTASVSFRVPATWRIIGRRKAHAHKINLTRLFAIHYALFVRRPIEETRQFIERYERQYGPVE